jgi:chorismate mutase
MPLQGIRGATVAEADRAGVILNATRQLLQAILEANPKLKAEDIASALFTTTEDLSSVYPAAAARELGWDQVPLMCAREIPVPGSLARCVRVLIHWNTDLPQNEIKHVYMGEAARLRPNLSKGD